MLEPLRRALLRREPIRDDDTDALRLVDGAGDGMPGVTLDDFAGRWLLQTPGPPPTDLVRRLRPPVSLYWKRHDASAQVAPEWLAGERLEGPFAVRENGLEFLVDFGAGYSQGLFLDQRENRKRVRDLAAGRRALNTFAYTCAFGVACVAGGGTALDLDLSRNSLQWGARNYERNGFGPATHDAVFGDVFDWLERFARKDRTFDLVVLDPPSFSRNRDGKVFRVEKDYARLVRLAAGVLSPSGVALCCTNLRKLAQKKFRVLVESGLPSGRKWRLHPAPRPPDFTSGLCLKSLWIE